MLLNQSNYLLRAASKLRLHGIFSLNPVCSLNAAKEIAHLPTAVLAVSTWFRKHLEQ